MKAILAKKIGMTQIFADNGKQSGVTILQAGPCIVTQVKTIESDGYEAVQIGFGKARNQAKPQIGHLKKTSAESRKLVEFRFAETSKLDKEKSKFSLGDIITVDSFKVGQKVTVRGISKGKGFAGTIKRHNFHRGPKTHGSHNYRAPGSIGAGYPEHVFKGQKMAGRMGHTKVTTKNLTIAMIDSQKNLMAIVGSVPGPKSGIVIIQAVNTDQGGEE